MSNYPNQHFPPPQPPRKSNGNLIAWILVAFFGAAFMLTLGMFIMFVVMNSREVAVENNGNRDARAPVVNEEGVAVQADRVANGNGRDSIADLPEMVGMEKAVLSKGTTLFRYDWNDPRLAYQFSLSVNPGEYDQESFVGRTMFTPSSAKPTDEEWGDRSIDSTGTGFLIHPDGLILTCAHVVGDAEFVDVTVEGAVQTGKVVATDPDNDLALLWVEGSGYEYLSIAKSDRIDQGDKIRVLGFPLTELLGESVKITNGFITGFSDKNSGIQIDAVVNPGNSGGPVVNDEGHVVGVASQLLDGRGISNLGLAVNASEIETFLKRCKFPYHSGTERLSTRQIKKAVVLIGSESRGLGKGESRAVAYESFYSPQDRSGIVSKKQERDSGTLLVDSRGQAVVRREAPKTLPVIIQELGQIGVESLPNFDDQRTWSNSTAFVLFSTRTERSVQGRPAREWVQPRYRGRRGIPGIRGQQDLIDRLLQESVDPFGGRREVVRERTISLVATLTQNYSVKSADEKQTVIRKSYKIETIESTDDDFSIELEYNGEFVFDKLEKRIVGGQFKGKATVMVDNLEHRVPFEYSYDIVDETQLAKEEADLAARIEARKERQKRVEAVSSKKLDLYDPER